MLHLTNEEEHRNRNRYKRVHAVCQEKKRKKMSSVLRLRLELTQLAVFHR